MNNKIFKYKLNQGDIIKIGRITIRIKEIKFEDNKNEINSNHLNRNGGINISKNFNTISEIVNIRKNKNKNKKVLETLITDGSQSIQTSQKNLNSNSKTLNLKENISINKSQSKTQIVKNKDNDINDNKSINSINILKEKSIEIKSSTKSKVCRICYMEEDEPNNPLLQPCTCSGSMKYIHYICLKHWINNKCYVKIDKNDDCSIYLIKPVECELCKTKLPDYIKKNGVLFPILEFKPDYKSYLIFESLTLDKNKKRFNDVVSLEKNKNICVGRGHDSNVVFSDISVSRTHCIFTVEGKNVYIQDNDSTFATLVLIQSPTIRLVENLPLYLQIGRTFFQYNIQKRTSFFWCCGISEKPNDNYYFKQNEKDIIFKKKYTYLSLSKSNILENDDNNDDNNKEGNKSTIDVGGVINIKKLIIQKNINNKRNSINGNKVKINENNKKNDIDINNSSVPKLKYENNNNDNIETQRENEKEPIITENKENKKIVDSKNESDSIYIEDEIQNV